MLRETNIIGVNQFIAVSTILITAATTSGVPDTISSASTSVTPELQLLLAAFLTKLIFVVMFSPLLITC